MYEKFKVPFDISVCAVCSFEKGDGNCRKPSVNKNLIKKDKRKVNNIMKMENLSKKDAINFLIKGEQAA